MGGGTREIHRDNAYMASGSHKGAIGTTLLDPGAMFDVFVAQTGLYIENTTTGTTGRIFYINRDEILATKISEELSGDLLTFGNEADGDAEDLTFTEENLSFGVESDASYIMWAYGDTYEIFKTPTKNLLLSKTWVDSSRGWKSDKKKLRLGWRREDIDLDRTSTGGIRRVFGPGQPDRGR